MMLTRTALRAHSAPICFTNRRCLSGSARLFVASEAAATRKEGDISSVFRSLSGGKDEALPPRFADVKKKLLGSKDQLQASWVRLLERLAEENEIIRAAGNKVIPEINFADIGSPSAEFDEAIRRRGVAIVRQVVPEAEARAYKDEIEEYVRLNPWTKAFPPHDPQVYELYWSRPQLRARAHPNMIATQRFLMQYWHTNNPEAEISTKDPVTYADRLRIRQPGDAGFALGPHVDGGSVERWEENGYGQGHVYDKIFEGKWEEFDSWEAGTRINAVSDLYHGAGSCSMLRLFQGWLSMSKTAPKEGTLLVNPLLSLSTAYMLLRPFFIPRSQPISDTAGEFSKEFLSPQNWVLEDDVSSNLQGAFPGHSQELNNILHPHLDLQHSMVHVPNITPGDYVAWHCDTIHAVDKQHQGKTDSSVIYIPACPATRSNLDYLSKQRDAFVQGLPPQDFPGGKGESEHTGRPTPSYLEKHAETDGLRAFGLRPFDTASGETAGEKRIGQYANEVLGY
ncbi:hypothetical protein FH972_025959 [Carpinus fangiana]|uniref:DUF1479 domain-containing protein n=1 Tax=Carpinus fangiana TaxID=176857 RepID=A0A5N6L332_9ROSI|nr:hypothetical protein FH972_025959 [Carpinus fangiana]